MRAVITRGMADATSDGVVASQYGPRRLPVTQDAIVAGIKTKAFAGRGTIMNNEMSEAGGTLTSGISRQADVVDLAYSNSSSGDDRVSYGKGGHAVDDRSSGTCNIQSCEGSIPEFRILAVCGKTKKLEHYVGFL